MVEEIKGDITNSNAQAICHQCNCVTRKAAHLAKTVFTKFPYADIYKERENKEIDYKNFPEGEGPGDIIIRGNGKDKRLVFNLLGQVYPGSPRYPNSKVDGKAARAKYFIECLKKISKMKKLKSIAFPDHIGCGAAGGDWNYYKRAIEILDEEMPNTKVYIVNFND